MRVGREYCTVADLLGSSSGHTNQADVEPSSCFSLLQRHQHHAQQPFLHDRQPFQGLSLRFILVVRSRFPNGQDRRVNFIFFYFPILDVGLVEETFPRH